MTYESSIRVAVFVDGSNLYFAIRDGLHRQDTIDVEKLTKKLLGGRQLVRIYYYHVPRLEGESDAARRHQAFLDRLNYVDYLQLRLGRLVPRPIKLHCQSCGKDIEHITHTQKGVDKVMLTWLRQLTLLRNIHASMWKMHVLCGEDGLKISERRRMCVFALLKSFYPIAG